MLCAYCDGYGWPASSLSIDFHMHSSKR